MKKNQKKTDDPEILHLQTDGQTYKTFSPGWVANFSHQTDVMDFQFHYSGTFL